MSYNRQPSSGVRLIGGLLALSLLGVIIGLANSAGQPQLTSEAQAEADAATEDRPRLTMGGSRRPIASRRPRSDSASATTAQADTDNTDQPSRDIEDTASGAATYTLADIAQNPEKYDFSDSRTFVAPNVFIVEAHTKKLLAQRLTGLGAQTGCVATHIADADIELALTTKELSTVSCEPWSIGDWVKANDPAAYERFNATYNR